MIVTDTLAVVQDNRSEEHLFKYCAGRSRKQSVSDNFQQPQWIRHEHDRL
jgi:hypothetical protein